MIRARYQSGRDAVDARLVASSTRGSSRRRRACRPTARVAACGMAKLDHVSLRVRDWQASRDWYVANIGLAIEFEIPERKTAALQDAAGLTLFVAESSDVPVEPSCGLFFQVDDVDETHRRLAGKG